MTIAMRGLVAGFCIGAVACVLYREWTAALMFIGLAMLALAATVEGEGL